MANILHSNWVSLADQYERGERAFHSALREVVGLSGSSSSFHGDRRRANNVQIMLSQSDWSIWAQESKQGRWFHNNFNHPTSYGTYVALSEVIGVSLGQHPFERVAATKKLDGVASLLWIHALFAAAAAAAELLLFFSVKKRKTLLKPKLSWLLLLALTGSRVIACSESRRVYLFFLECNKTGFNLLIHSAVDDSFPCQSNREGCLSMDREKHRNGFKVNHKISGGRKRLIVF